MAVKRYTLVDCNAKHMIEEENFMAHKVLHASDDYREIIAYVCNHNFNAHCYDLTVISRFHMAMSWVAYPMWTKTVRDR